MNDRDFVSKIHDLYKFVNEGWSIQMAEAKAGVGITTKLYPLYKESEHYEKIRIVYKSLRRGRLQFAN